MKIVELNGNGKVRNAVMELCKGIETVTNPIRVLHYYIGSMPDDFDIYGYIEGKFTHAIDPDYGELKEQLAKEGGRSDTEWRVRLIERKAWFAAGCLFGMKLAGKPMDEIQKMGLSIVTTGC